MHVVIVHARGGGGGGKGGFGCLQNVGHSNAKAIWKDEAAFVNCSV